MATSQCEVKFFHERFVAVGAQNIHPKVLGVITNTFNPPSEKNNWFKTIGIDGIWDSFADSCELGVVKPDAKIYLAALNPLKVAPENAIFVGHAQYEIDVARALGMTTVRFNPDVDCTDSDHLIAHFSDLLDVAQTPFTALTV